MSDELTDGVLGSLPRTRPHRRSAKRGPAPEPARPAQAGSPRAQAATQTTQQTPAKAKAKSVRPKTSARAKPAQTQTKTQTRTQTRTQTTAKAKATPSPGAPPVRSLQSATTPRATSDRSRKPGVTSQAHHQSPAGPDRPPVSRRSAPPAAEPAGALGTAVQAAAELTEIGLKASARAVRGALSRLPRP